MNHGIVYAQPGTYAGWPANHGAWQWGNEFLVGFIRGPYKKGSMHNVDGRALEKVLARSVDGGKTWSVEKPNVDFDCTGPATAPPAFNLSDSIIRVSGVYDHGGDNCLEQGGFYLSRDRGSSWSGPYLFQGLEDRFSGDMICTGRTRVFDDLVFLSAGQRSIWGTDYTFCAKHDGEKFIFQGVVLEDDARAVMPSVARINGRLVAVLRRRKTAVREGWIDAVFSDDDGLTWSSPKQVGVTGSNNGNPPALCLSNGVLYSCFANRDFGSLVVAKSRDGVKWETSLIREGGKSDIGYPQLFVREDGTPVCVYYWADEENPHQHIAWTSL